MLQKCQIPPRSNNEKDKRDLFFPVFTRPHAQPRTKLESEPSTTNPQNLCLQTHHARVVTFISIFAGVGCLDTRVREDWIAIAYYGSVIFQSQDENSLERLKLCDWWAALATYTSFLSCSSRRKRFWIGELKFWGRKLSGTCLKAGASLCIM